MYAPKSILLAGLAGYAAAGTTLWDGRFNAKSESNLENWSWSNQAGAYQYYIHGTGKLASYVNFASDFKNPADTASDLGAKITIDSTSQWNSDGMLRTELIPSTDAAINEGTVYYHFSLMRKAENAPNTGYEHQVCFFESHFTELKYGLISGESGTADPALKWYANSESQWNATLAPGVWHNVAYEIDFDGGSVSYYHSTGADDLKKVAGPVSVSASSNGADWHLGVLRLNAGTDDTKEDWYFSGVYIEKGDLTTSVADGKASSGSASSGSTSSAASAAAAAVASTPAAAVSSAAAVSTPAAVSSPAVASTPAAPSTLVTIASSAAPSAAATTAAAAAADSTTNYSSEDASALYNWYEKLVSLIGLN